MSGSISFTQISQGNLVPLFQIEFSAQNAVGSDGQKPSLLVGQYTPPATNAPAPNVPVFIPSQGMARQLFGARSMLGRMVSTYLEQDLSGIWCVPVPDAAGAQAATGSIVITGPATLPGAVPLYICGIAIPVGVSVGDTAATIAADMVTAINAVLDLPVNASASGGTVNLVAAHKGAQGNNIDVRLAYLGPQNGEVVPQGVTVTITAMSGGAIDPDLGFLAAALGDQRYDFLGYPYSGAADFAEITALMNESSGRWAPTRRVYGHAFTMQPGTLSSLLTTGGTLNDKHQDVIGVRGSPSPPWDWVADWMGATAVAVRANPALPTWTLELQTVLPPSSNQWWLYSEQQALLAAGIALPKFTQYGNPTILRAVTTYKTNQYGVTDQTFQDDCTLFNTIEISRRVEAAFATKFGRCVVVPNGTRVGPLQRAVSPNDVTAELAALYAGMEDDGLVTDADAMLAATTVLIDPNNPKRIDVSWNVDEAAPLAMIAVAANIGFATA